MQRWRGYLQLREVANWGQTSVAMLQDTFRPLAEQVGPVTQAMMPYVFTQPVNPVLIGADRGAGLGFFSGIGRPHYQHMIREAADPDLGDNVFITEHGRFLTPEGREPQSQEEFDRASLWIDDAHFWVSLETFRRMLVETEGLNSEQADTRIQDLQAKKQIHPKGVRVAARFSQPVAVGAAITLHHHYLEPQLSRAGYPTGEKSEVLFAVTYAKIYGPEIVRGRDLHYPPQANVYQDQTLTQPPADVRRSIGEQVNAFASQLGFPAFFAKGSRESGSRNLRDFDASVPTGGADPAVLADAAEFTFQVSSGQDVVLSQDASLTNSNQTFLTPAIVQHMRNRAVREFGVDVNLDQPGKADVTTVRVTVTSPRPDVPYSPAHVLLITSYTGKATNIARQNVAEPLRPEFLQPEIREDFLNGLMSSAPEAMRAMADFTRRFWHEGVTLPDGRVIPSYKETYRQQHGATPREFDARGVPYWYPTWLMLDYVPSATFQSVKDGQPLADVRILDIDPGDPEKGTLPVFTLQDRHGNRIQGRVAGHVPWLLEWNVGIGQVPEYNRREQYWEYDRAKQETARGGTPDQWFERVQWGHVGVADRQALKSWLVTARETRDAKGFPAAWPESPAPPAFRPAAPSVSERPAVPVRVDPLAASLRGVQARLGAVPLTENTLSLWLSAYAFRQLGSSLRVRDLRSGEEAEYKSKAEAFTGDVLTVLRDPALVEGMSQLIVEANLPIAPDRLRNLLQGSDSDAQAYRERIALQVLGDVLADPQTVVPVAILPTPLSPEAVAERLNQPNRFVVVVGKELRMDHAVEPFALSAAGQPINVLGVHTDWLTPEGELKRVQVYDLASRMCWECALTAPLRLPDPDHATATPRAYIVDLPREQELQQHARVTEALRAGGIEPVNPAGEAQRRADDKAYLLARRDPDRTHWTLLAQKTATPQVRNRVEEFARTHPGEPLVVQPRAGTSEAEGVQVIPPGDRQIEEAVQAVALLQEQGMDVILQRFWGNVTMGGREFVLRSNVSGDGIQSEYVLVAPFGERVVSAKRWATAYAREDVLEHLIGPQGTIAISPERLTELDRQAVEIARQINQGVPSAERIGLIALDRRFRLDENGQLQQVILEANARGGGLIAAEPQAVNQDFWRTSGLLESPSAIQWRAYLQNPARAQLLLSPQYPDDMLPEKQAQLVGWLDGLRDLRTPQGTPAFPEKAGIFMDRTPGRAVLMGRGLDYLDNNGGSVGFPTRQEVVGFVEIVDGLKGQVEVYVVDPAPELVPDYPDDAKGPRSFNLGHPWVNPDLSVRTLSEWDDWAGPVEQARRVARSPSDPNRAKMNYADDMAAAAVAFLRTEFGDPSGKAREFFDRLQREGKGLRIAVAGDLPVGGGLSSSSAVLESVLQAVDKMADLRLGPEGLINAGFAERVYTGVRAGNKDHGHMMTDAAFRGVVPTRMIEPLILPPGLSLLLIDSKVSRDNAPQFSAKMQEPGNDERNIKWRTGIGYALGVLWIRQHHPELESRLLPGVFPASPHGLLRELQPGSENGLTLTELYTILREIPAAGFTREDLRRDLPNFQAELESMFGQTDPPPQPYPVREMVLFGLAEEARNREMVRLGHQVEQGIEVSEIQPQMLGVVAKAQDGDRVVKYQISGSVGDEHLELREEQWNWRMTNDRLDWLIEHSGDPEAVLWKQSGWRERSIEPLDRLVDLVRFFSDQSGGGVAEAMVGGAGLGGTVVTLMVRPDLIQPLLDFLLKHYYRDFLKLDLKEVPFRLAKPGKAAGVFAAPLIPFMQAGLEEPPADSEAAVDVIDGTTTLVLNRPLDTTAVSPNRGDAASSVLALARRIFHRRNDSHLAAVAVYNSSGLQSGFEFDLSDPVGSARRFSEASGIPLDRLRVGLDVHSSSINTQELPGKLQDIGIRPENIVAFPQMEHAINVALRDDSDRPLHERSPWFTQSFDLFIGMIGATEISSWATGAATLPGVRIQAVFFPEKARQAKDSAELWKMRLTNQRSVTGERKTVFHLHDLTDTADSSKLYASTFATGYMNFPGIEYGDSGVTATTMVFQEGREPVVVVDQLSYVQSRQDSLERSLAISKGLGSDYAEVVRAVKEFGPAPRHPVVIEVADLVPSFPYEEMDRGNWPDGFLGLTLVSSRAYDLAGKPVPPFAIRGNGHRDTLAAAVASGWLRGIANQTGVSPEEAGKAGDRLARDAMGARMDQDLHRIRIVAFEGDRDGSASWKFGTVLGKKTQAGLEETPPSPIVSHQLQETGIEGYRRLIYTLENGSTWAGGVVKTDVRPGAIAPTAYVAPYSYVAGQATLLQDNAQLLNGSAAIDSAVSANAQLAGSVAEKSLVHSSAVVSSSVMQPAFGQDDWSYSAATAKDPALSVRNHSVTFEGGTYQVELGEGASAQGSVLQDSYVGPGSSVRGSAVYISHLGPKSQLDGGVKLWLAVAKEGHANIAGVQHRADGTETPAALEWAEGAIVGLSEDQYPGEQFRERRVGYTEVVVSNHVPLVHYDGGQLTVEQYPVPPITLAGGDYGIFSIFAGSPNPGSIKTNGRSTPGVVTRLTGGPGEQTSQHGRIVADPLSIVASFSNVIGRLLGFPAWDDPEALLREPEITHLGALSAVGIDAQLGLNGLEAWGQVAPGEARGQLGRASGIAPWVFLYSPDTLFSLMGRLGSRYDDLPQKILESGLALSQWMLNQEQAKDAQANAAVIDRLHRYIAGYAALIDSGAWTGEWVQTDSYRHPAGWSRTAAGDWETGRLSLKEAHHTIHPLADSVPYSQVSLQQLLTLPPGVERPDWSEWTPYYLKPEDLQVDPPTPLEQLRKVSDQFKFWRIIGQDGRFYYTVEGGRIEQTIDLVQIHQSAVIGPGTVLRGAGTTVGEGSRLLRVIADQLVAGKEVQLTAVRAQNTSIGDNVKLTWAKLGPDVTIGSGTTGAYVAVANGSTIGMNNTFEPFALVVNSSTSAGNVIGVTLVNSRVLSGFMGRHLSTAVHGLDQQPVQFRVRGRLYNLNAASLNVAGGMLMQGDTDSPVKLSAAYPLSLTTVRPGQDFPSEIGVFSVLKNLLVLDGEVLPLTFHAFNNLASSDPRFATPGRHNDAIGGALDFPGIFLRNFIYRTKKGIWDDLAAQGLTPEEIVVHPRLLQADYMVEATIVGTLRQVRNQLSQVDSQAEQHLWPALDELIQSVEQDLDQIQRFDQSTLGRRSPADRQRIAQLIATVRQQLESLPGQRPSETTVSRSGHSARQLLDGVRRLAENLDGRWRMRNHTFTEVEWRYVAYDADGKPQDKWVPVKAVEVIPLNEDAAAKTLVVLTPDTVLEGVRRLLALRGASGQKVQVAVIVSDTQQAEEVGELLAGVDLQLELSSVNLETEQLGVEDAILRIDGWASQRGLQMQVVRTPDQFRDLGRLLVPVDSQARWNAGMEEDRALAPSA
ncbi:MAG: hypothetical protein Q7J69_06285 [Candidatus Omnitrophota bacterium]|nr:hypothetical protein [Candidatus Omnitrophota bacterium]